MASPRVAASLLHHLLAALLLGGASAAPAPALAATSPPARARSPDGERRLGWITSIFDLGEHAASAAARQAARAAAARGAKVEAAEAAKLATTPYPCWHEDVVKLLNEHCDALLCKLPQWQLAADKFKAAKVARRAYDRALLDLQMAELRGDADDVLSRLQKQADDAKQKYKEAKGEASEAILEAQLPSSGDEDDDSEDRDFDWSDGLALVGLLAVGGAACCLWRHFRKAKQVSEQTASV